jgi:hypothetical protein
MLSHEPNEMSHSFATSRTVKRRLEPMIELARLAGRLSMLKVVQNADRVQLKFGHPWTFCISRTFVSVPWIHYQMPVLTFPKSHWKFSPT